MTGLTTDDRGVSELLGAILLFGLLVSLLVIVQSSAVPSANRAVEFDQNQQLQRDFQSLDSDVAAVAATGRDRATVFTAGVSYPNRFILFNPGPVAGTLSTTEADFSVSGAVAAGETGDYWNGSERTFDSGRLRYEAPYNYYDAPTTAYQTGVVYNRFDNGARQVDDGAFVSGRSIDLVALDGSRGASQVSPVTLDLVPLSTETETVRVTGNGSDPIVVTLATDLSPDQWASFLSEELDENGGYVTDVRAAPGGVAVEFAPGSYELTLADVAVGGGAERAAPTYLTTADATPSVESGGDLTVEVRDAFNDPEPGVDVTFSTTDGTLSATSATTDDTGTASVTFTPRSGVSTATVTAQADLDGSGAIEADERVTFTVTVTGTGDDGGVGGLNPAGQGSVRQTGATNNGCTAPNTGTGTVALTDADCRVLVAFENLGDDTRTVEQARVSFYSPESYDVGTGNNARRRPTPETVALGGETLEVGGDFENVSLAPIGENRGTATYQFAFGVSEGRYNVVEGDFFVVTFVYENGDVSTYFIGPQ